MSTIDTQTSELEQIVESVFSTMLETELMRTDEPLPSDQDLLTAMVHIVGEWTGSAVLTLTPAVSVTSAATMLQIDISPDQESSVSLLDQQDVASELVNMIGGNLKSLLPGPSFLSLPAIVSGSEIGLHLHNAERLEDIVWATPAGLLSVQLFAKLLRPMSHDG